MTRESGYTAKKEKKNQKDENVKILFHRIQDFICFCSLHFGVKKELVV